MLAVNIYKIRHIFKLVLSVFKEYPREFFLMTMLGFLAGIFGSVGIGAIIPLFSFLTNSGSGSDLISKVITNIFSFFGLPFSLPLLLTFMVMLFILKSATHFLASYMSIRVSSRYERNLRTDMFESVLRSDWPHLIEQKPAYIERVIMEDVSNSANIFSFTSDLVLTLASLLTYLIVAVNISIKITLLTVVLGAIIFLAIKPIFYKTRKITEKLAIMTKVTVHHVLENLIGVKIVKTLAAEEKVIERGNKNFQELREYRIRSIVYQNLVGSLTEPIGITFIAVLFLISYDSPMFNLAAFAAIVYLVQKMFSFIQTLQGKINNINAAIPYLEITHDYLQKSKVNKELDNLDSNFSFNDKISLKNLSFSYDQDKLILDNINIEIKKSEMVGFIGPSGGGKTTLVDLILRLFKPGSGEILIDGKNIDSMNLKSWRSNVGYVPQDIFLINDTIENNIKFYDDSIGKERVIEAAKMANIYDFIETLPKKFHTNIGERGIKLSGGQRQRIALARTLARKPEILILDEATSLLDNESETLIQRSIENLKQKITIVIIAHRLSTIISSDILFILENGKIAEQGKPAELLKDKDSYFYKVYNIREK
ncbi:MAG: ABC transporter ATP-binding protein [bacterium]|nr:ABC transporter ATP-binding protein [bacterium]